VAALECPLKDGIRPFLATPYSRIRRKTAFKEDAQQIVHFSVDILQPAENKGNKVAKSRLILFTLFRYRVDN